MPVTNRQELRHLCKEQQYDGALGYTTEKSGRMAANGAQAGTKNPWDQLSMGREGDAGNAAVKRNKNRNQGKGDRTVDRHDGGNTGSQAVVLQAVSGTGRFASLEGACMLVLRCLWVCPFLAAHVNGGLGGAKFDVCTLGSVWLLHMIY